jgi:heptosyltransferase-3
MRLLIVSLRYLGDAFLAVSPVLASVQECDADCEVSVLTFKGNEKILEELPGITEIITVERKPSKFQQLRQLLSRWNQYDCVYCAQTGDRPFLYSWCWGKKHYTFVPEKQGFLKRLLASHSQDFRGDILVSMFGKKVLPKIGIPWANKMLAPTTGDESGVLKHFGLEGFSYITLQPFTRTEYKELPLAHWVAALTPILEETDLHLVISGAGKHDAEVTEDLTKDLSAYAPRIHSLVNKASFAQLADVIRHAEVYVGLDTGVTHVAAATGIPVITVYGPTDTLLWAPACSGGANSYVPCAPKQINGTVILLQDARRKCQPCDRPGCPEYHDDKTSLCMQTFCPERITDEIRTVLKYKA